MLSGYDLNSSAHDPLKYIDSMSEDRSQASTRKSPLPLGPQSEIPTPSVAGFGESDASHSSLDSALSTLSAPTPPNPSLPAECRRSHNFIDPNFDVGSRYVATQIIGKGAFGYVVAADCQCTGNKVAIKKIKNATSDKVAALRLLREMTFLREVRGHPNIIHLHDVLVRQSHQVDVYLVTELMEADLEQIIKSSQSLSEDHVRYLSNQMLCGLRHLHAHGIIHRDLKPSNLVVDSFCRLKICDLGLSRHLCDGPGGREEEVLFTDYVVTRWYRPPELLLGSKRYGQAIDMWAAGCVIAELLLRRPVLTGDDPSDMLLRISLLLGLPADADARMLAALPGVSAGARAFLTSLPNRCLAALAPPAGHLPGGRVTLTPAHVAAVRAGRLEETLRGAGSLAAVELVRALLRWDPRARLQVEAALMHPFLAPLYEPPPPPPPPARRAAAAAAATERFLIAAGGAPPAPAAASTAPAPVAAGLPADGDIVPAAAGPGGGGTRLLAALGESVLREAALCRAALAQR